MPTITMSNTVDGWVSPDRASKFGDTRLSIHSTANAYVYFGRPNLPAGSIITSAVLRVIPGVSTGNTSVTVNVHRLTSAFDPASMVWTAQPTVGSQVATLTRPWYNSGAAMDFSLTADVQNIVDGGAWYGWRLSSASTDVSQFVFSGQSFQPMNLIITFQSPPLAPANLYPNGNANINDSKPTLSWTSQGSASGEQLAFRVQIAADLAFTTSLYTSNEISSKASSYDLDFAAPVFTALTAGQSRYWRVQVKNTMGVWSAYSVPAQFTYQTPFALAITAPAGATTADPTPTVTWTYTGVQVAWQVIVDGISNVAISGASGARLYDSGINYGTTLTTDIPIGIILWENASYNITVRVWSSGQVVSVAGVPSYDQAVKTIQWVPAGATPPVQLLVTAETPPLPARLIRWQYTGVTAAARFILTRARYGVIEATWDLTASAVQEGVTQWYRYVDRITPGRADVTYSVMTVYSTGATSATVGNPSVMVHLDYLVPWIQSVYDPINRAFCLVNYDINPGFTEISDVVTPVSGAPFLATQTLGKYNGEMSGTISWQSVPGNASLTGEKMRQNFLWMRENPRVYILWQDQAIEAFIYKAEISSVGTADGKNDYVISFNFVQV